MNTSTSLRKKADALQPKIDNCLRERLTNTRKRAQEDQHMRREGRTLQTMQEVLRKVADLHDSRALPDIFQAIRYVSDVDVPVRGLLFCDREREEYPNAPQRELSELQKAIRSLLTPVDPAKERLHRLEVDVKLRDIPGFFPSRPAAVRRMLELADVGVEMKVLEPSAGAGAIADWARDLGALVDVVEINPSLREILTLKHHTLLPEHDFLDVSPESGLYDRVLMNPPFENFQDIDHVVHAYKLLKPGGLLVAMMGPSGFFRSTAKAEEFRSWIEGIGADVEDLPSGSFEKTGCPGKLIRLVKPACRVIAYRPAVRIDPDPNYGMDAGVPDPEYQSRIDAQRVSAEFAQKSARPLDAGKQPITDSPLFGGVAQGNLFS